MPFWRRRSVALLAAQKNDHNADPETSGACGISGHRGSRPRVQIHEVFQVGAPPEMLLSWYLRRLNWLSPNKDRELDTSEVRMADTRPAMTYHITFHNFDDVCLDPGAATATEGSDAPPCKLTRYGKEKRHLLENNRVGFEQGVWIDRVTFMWMTREATGEILRRTIELRDAGISDDWKRYTLVTQITLAREAVSEPTQEQSQSQ